MARLFNNSWSAGYRYLLGRHIVWPVASFGSGRYVDVGVPVVGGVHVVVFAEGFDDVQVDSSRFYEAVL